MFKHILISTDGSQLANKSAKAGIALAKALGARVTAYFAAEPSEPIFADGYAFNVKVIEALEQHVHEAGQKRVDVIGKMAKAAGVPCTLLVAKAPTAYEGIVDTAKKQKCDAIFMASHGRSGFAALLMGSVTQKVLAHSKLPVVVYR